MIKPRAQRNITIDMLAEQCGVSKSTVSRVLNNHERNFSVLPEKRELILRTARQMNYRPDVMARSLKTQQTRIVAILGFTTFDGPSIYVSLAARTVEALQKAGYSVCSSFPHHERGINAMFPWKVDGALVFNRGARQCLDEVENADIPYIAINGSAGPNGVAFKFDEKKGMTDVMDHLCCLGHQRIAYINTAGIKRHYSVTERHKYFLAECQNRNLPVLPGHDVYGIKPEAFLREIVIGNQATAVLAYSHAEALNLYFMAQRLGIAIPGRFSLICFNDVYPCAALIPSMTVMDLPLTEMGTTAAKTLINMMADQAWKTKDHPDIIFKEKLIVRESTGKPSVINQ